MKITIDPMPALRQGAENKINEHFSRLASLSVQQEQEHSIKRAEAQRVATGQQASVEFAGAAALEGLSINDLANLVLGKPDEVMTRANTRRTLILAVRKTTVPSELEQILDPLGKSVLTV